MTPSEALAAAMKRPHKYRARKTVVDGIRFDSAAEARRYSELRLLERAGKIAALQIQQPYPFWHNDVLICTYIADFTYFDASDRSGKTVEDVKGMATPEYKLKKNLMKAFYGIDILETGKRRA